MYGAILGDIIGFPYEFNYKGGTRDFNLFEKYSSYTDDSALTIAVCDALLKSKDMLSTEELKKNKNQKTIKKNLVTSILDWANDPKYAHLKNEYGGRFADWLESSNPKPYNSCGNGSGMRVSSAGWLCDTLEDTLTCAKLTAEITHNHEEGIKGAQAVAAVIFLARTGKSKAEIKDYVEKTFHYDLSGRVDDIKPKEPNQSEICQDCVPNAIKCFLEADSLEAAVRNAVKIKGDTDTVGCMAGSMAEAFYGVPAALKDKARECIESDMLDVLNRFNKQKLGYKALAKEDFRADIKNPVDYENQINKVGDVNYSEFISAMEEQSNDQLNSKRGRDYASLAAKAARAGYPLSDINALWDVRCALNMKYEGELSEQATEAKQRCEDIWNRIIENKKDGVNAALTEEDRQANLKAMKEGLNEYVREIGDDKSKLSLFTTEIAAAGLDARRKAGLSQAERMRMAGTLRDAFDILDCVDPPRMMSSRAFRNMKSSFRTLVETAERTDFDNPEQAEEYERQKTELIKRTKRYLKYKKDQNGGLHSRSEIEYKRVTMAESLLQKLEEGSFDKTAKAPADMMAHDLIRDARKSLELNGKSMSNSDKEKATSVLYVAKQLKDAKQPVSYDVLMQLSNGNMRNNAFKNSARQLPVGEIEEAVSSGAFDNRVNWNQSRSLFRREKSAWLQNYKSEYKKAHPAPVKKDEKKTNTKAGDKKAEKTTNTKAAGGQNDKKTDNTLKGKTTGKKVKDTIKKK